MKLLNVSLLRLVAGDQASPEPLERRLRKRPGHARVVALGTVARPRNPVESSPPTTLRRCYSRSL